MCIWGGLFFFFSNIKKHLNYMEVRNLTVNICLSSGKLCLKCFFKASYFHPARIPYSRINCIQLFVSWTVFRKIFCCTKKLLALGYFQLASVQKVVYIFCFLSLLYKPYIKCWYVGMNYTLGVRLLHGD